MEDFRGAVGDLQIVIREAMTNILGELGALRALSYTGDVSDGNLRAFARRVSELFGLGAPAILSNIVSWIRGRFGQN